MCSKLEHLPVRDSLDKVQHSFLQSVWEFVLPNYGAQLCESCY